MTLIIQKPTGAKLVLSKIQQYPAVLGEPWGGGYFAGYISHAANGSPTHALIVAPRATGATGTGYTLTTGILWKTVVGGTLTNTQSSFDGLANTNAMVTLGISNFPAAQFCKNLNIGGFSDWYLPSRYELEIAFFNFKPTTEANSIASGQNPYSVPARNTNYQPNYPPQTYLPSFSSSAQGFVGSAHWSSTNFSSTLAYHQYFNTGSIEVGAFVAGSVYLSVNLAVRAFRRIAL